MAIPSVLQTSKSVHGCGAAYALHRYHLGEQKQGCSYTVYFGHVEIERGVEGHHQNTDSSRFRRPLWSFIRVTGLNSWMTCRIRRRLRGPSPHPKGPQLRLGSELNKQLGLTTLGRALSPVRASMLATYHGTPGGLARIYNYKAF